VIRVLFFARLREELDCDFLEMAYGEHTADLDTLQECLSRERGDLWRDALGQDNIIRAVNQEVALDNLALADGDEVAFFPPVTGG
jgi:molybdopterin converting factor subunit 1